MFCNWTSHNLTKDSATLPVGDFNLFGIIEHAAKNQTQGEFGKGDCCGKGILLPVLTVNSKRLLGVFFLLASDLKKWLTRGWFFSLGSTDALTLHILLKHSFHICPYLKHLV